MSMYADYLSEKAGDGIVEDEKGFATYRFMPDGVTIWLMDVYVKPEFRRSQAAITMGDKVMEIGKAKGCLEMIGTSVPSLPGSTPGLKLMLAFGMELKSAMIDLIVLKKEIK